MSEEPVIEPIAITGMAIRAPGAPDLEAFWRLILEGREAMTRFEEEQLRASGVPDAMLSRPDYVPVGAIVPDIDRFDADLFGFSPAEAAMLDPQHRLFLECAWEALEHAGHGGARSRAAIGVFGGMFMNKYLPLNLYTNAAFLRSPMALFARNYNDKDFLCGRVAFALDLRGPAVTVQTACSTSLVATHLATQALIGHECDMALVGGVALNLPAEAGYIALEGTMFSQDGRCRPFDAHAKGTLFGSGAAMVVLRRLADAVADGDAVHAVILGTAINNDGTAKMSFTAPNPHAQSAVIAAAQAVAGVDPETIGYIEAHGTGTPMGDPIEVAALAEAFGKGAARARTCALGSVKANVGHLDAAAGVAGLIRATLALSHETIPPQAAFETENPRLELERTPFYVPREPVPWRRGAAPRRAGVSSFGVGGTNAHVVLEEAPALASRAVGPSREHVLVLSARTPKALEEASARLADRLAASDPPFLRDVALTLAEGRRRHPVRRAVVARETGEAVERLRVGFSAAAPPSSEPRVVFLFPGVGTHYPDMGRGLYASEPVFREAVDTCAEHLAPLLGMDVRRFVLSADCAEQEVDYGRVPHALAATFTVEYALAKLWISFGIRPVAMAGHSLGEYVAACLAGVLDLSDALELTVRRGRIFDAIPDGRMLGIGAAAERAAPLLPDGVVIGAINAPGLCMASGLEADLVALRERLSRERIAAKLLPIRMASHSKLVEPFLADFREIVAGYRLAEPTIPYLSCETGTWVRAEDATDPQAWARQLRAPVQFERMMASLRDVPGAVLLEVGPGNTLSGLVGAQRATPSPVAIPSMRRADQTIGDREMLISALGRLWQTGIEPDWRALCGADAARVPLPTYPFQRKRHWIEPGWAAGPGYGGPEAAALHAGSEDGTRGEPEIEDEASVGGLSPLETRIARAWSAVLGTKSIGPDDDFTALGGHSLLAAQVVAEMRHLVGVPLTIVDLFAAPTVRELASLVAARESGADTGLEPDLEAEVRLDSAITAGDLPPVAEGTLRAVFLTGATGFLGAYLLDALIGRSDAVVFCLVRATDADSGERRIRARLDALGLPQPPPGRLVAVPGDLETERFGLTTDAFEALAAGTDCVLHCGAWVNFARPYSVLAKANVGGTAEALRLAATGRLKPVHHISTIFTTMGAITAGAPFVGEDDPLPPPTGHDTGYTQSKWVAEGVCRLAQARGIPVAIHRPGNILGDTRTGVVNRDDYITRMIEGCVELGAAPLRQYPLPVAPVDDVARAVVALVTSGAAGISATGRTWHVIRPEPLAWNRIFEAVRAAGYAVPSRPWDMWRNALAARLAHGESNALAPVADLLHAASGDRPMPHFETERTIAALTAGGFSFAPLDDDYFARILARLVEDGVLAPPRRGGVGEDASVAQAVE